jgi:hypothetical protein
MRQVQGSRWMPRFGEHKNRLRFSVQGQTTFGSSKYIALKGENILRTYRQTYICGNGRRGFTPWCSNAGIPLEPLPRELRSGAVLIERLLGRLGRYTRDIILETLPRELRSGAVLIERMLGRLGRYTRDIILETLPRELRSGVVLI